MRSDGWGVDRTQDDLDSPISTRERPVAPSLIRLDLSLSKANAERVRTRAWSLLAGIGRTNDSRRKDSSLSRFYGYFAAAYGAIWFSMVVIAVLWRKHVNAGEFGLWGFPIIALFYAVIRSGSANGLEAEVWELRQRVQELEERLGEERDD
jgi:hypothetical protein